MLQSGGASSSANPLTFAGHLVAFALSILQATILHRRRLCCVKTSLHLALIPLFQTRFLLRVIPQRFTRFEPGRAGTGAGVICVCLFVYTLSLGTERHPFKPMPFAEREVSRRSFATFTSHHLFGIIIVVATFPNVRPILQCIAEEFPTRHFTVRTLHLVFANR